MQIATPSCRPCLLVRNTLPAKRLATLVAIGRVWVYRVFQQETGGGGILAPIVLVQREAIAFPSLSHHCQ
jgi:hypothetical protein